MPKIIALLSRVSVFILLFIAQVAVLQAQTESKAIDKKFFEFDLYPFELAESSGRWGLKFKEVYDRKLAVDYLKRNFHYNTRVDTLIRNAWLALPFYDKFERWSYGPRFQFMAATRGKNVDMFSISGELLATNVTEFLPEKINMEKRDVVLTMKTGNEWKWYYEGDFYNKNTTIYYQSPTFDKLEIVRDTIIAEFNFITEKQGVMQRYNAVGHELSGNVLAFNNSVKSVPEKEQQSLPQTEKKVAQQETVVPQTTTVNTAEQKAATEAEVKVAVAKALKEANEAQAKELKSAEAKLKAESDKEIAALKAQLEAEQKARVAAELKALAEAKRADAAEAKFKKEEEEKNAALAKLKEALEQAKATAAQATANAENKTDREAEIKSAVAKALKEAEERERKTAEQKEQEEAKRTAETEKAKQAAEAKAKAEEEQKNNAIKALKEAEEKARLAAEQKAKAEAEQAATAAAKAKAEEDQKLKKEAEIKAAVEKALKEAAEKERLAAEQKEEEAIRIAEAKAKAELAAAKAQPVEKPKEETPVAPTQQPEGELIQDKNIIMKKIMTRDKLIAFDVFAENNLYGLKSDAGTVLIYPAMKSMSITAPANKELKYVNVNAAIEFEMDGVILRITNPDFEGPENLGTYAVKCATCSSGFKNAALRWNKAKQKYIFE